MNEQELASQQQGKVFGVIQDLAKGANHKGIGRRRDRAKMSVKTGLRLILLTTLLTMGVVGLVQAQEATGETAEKVKQEIIQLEHDKEKAYMSTTGPHPYAADWVARVDADDIAFIGQDGTTKTKAEHIEGFRSGKSKIYFIKEHDMHVRIYGEGGNGTTAVVTYLHESTGDHHGQRSTIVANGTDVFVKLDGVWRW